MSATGDIEQTILSYLQSKFTNSVDSQSILVTSDLFDEAIIDSFGIVELIEFVDTTYHVDLSPVDFYEGPQRTIAGIAAYIHARQEK